MVKHPSNYKNELQIQPYLHSSKKSIRRSSLVLPMATVVPVPVVPATVFGGTKRRRQGTKRRRRRRKTKRR